MGWAIAELGHVACQNVVVVVLVLVVLVLVLVVIVAGAAAVVVVVVVVVVVIYYHRATKTHAEIIMTLIPYSIYFIYLLKYGNGDPLDAVISITFNYISILYGNMSDMHSWIFLVWTFLD